MKENVDLTLNRMFSAPAIPSDSEGITRMFDRIWMTGIKYPWEYNYENPLENNLVLVGTSVERKKIKEYNRYEDGTKCPCCGKDIRIIPWKNEYLCKECVRYFDYVDGKKKLWKFSD